MKLSVELGDFLLDIADTDALQRAQGRSDAILLLQLPGARYGLKPGPGELRVAPHPGLVDELARHVLLSLEEPTSQTVARKFRLTSEGRAVAARVRAQEAGIALASQGQAPAPLDALRWLIELRSRNPERFAEPRRLLDAAVDEGLISEDSREALARVFLDLLEQDYLAGDLLGVEQFSDVDEIAHAQHLRLTLKAEEIVQGDTSTASMTFNAPVTAGQIAGRDIANFVTFADVLDRAEAHLDSLTEVDEQTREEARGILAALRGRTVAVSGKVLTGAGGGLLATVFAHVLGLGAA